MYFLEKSVNRGSNVLAIVTPSKYFIQIVYNLDILHKRMSAWAPNVIVLHLSQINKQSKSTKPVSLQFYLSTSRN